MYESEIRGVKSIDINRHTYTHINTAYIHCNR